MIFDLIVILAFVAVGLKIVFPAPLSKILRINPRLALGASIFLVLLYSLTLLYLVILEPFSLTLILFTAVSLLVLSLIKRTSADLFFRNGLISLFGLAILASLRLNFLAEVLAVLSFVFLVGGFLSLFYDQNLDL